MLALAIVLAASTTVPAVPHFSSSVESVSVDVVIQDAHGSYDTNFPQGDFVVLENGIPQEITSFRHNQIPTDLTFLLDTSDSMAGHLHESYRAAAQFIQAVQPDTVRIVQFSEVARIVQDATEDPQEAQGALATLAAFADAGYKLKTDPSKMKSKRAEDIVAREALLEWLRRRAMYGSTALYNALYAAFSDLSHPSTDQEDREREQDSRRRKVIVLITDGEDTASIVKDEDIINQAIHLEIPVYAICLRARPLPGEHDHETDYFLKTVAEKSGGEYRIIPNIVELSGWYRHVADILQSQYRLEYASSDTVRNGQWRAIQVSVGKAGYQIRSKQGYYAPCDPDQPCAKKSQ